ncbi:uncharacterized protein PS065_016596 [Dugong dugon]
MRQCVLRPRPARLAPPRPTGCLSARAWKARPSAASAAPPAAPAAGTGMLGPPCPRRAPAGPRRPVRGRAALGNGPAEGGEEAEGGGGNWSASFPGSRKSASCPPHTPLSAPARRAASQHKASLEVSFSGFIQLFIEVPLLERLSRSFQVHYLGGMGSCTEKLPDQGKTDDKDLPPEPTEGESLPLELAP